VKILDTYKIICYYLIREQGGYMENRFEISMLIDYYGTLLTEKQFNVMTLYYNEDLSLAEIAEINKTSRQAIYDLIKRCCKQLHSYDEKLKLSKKIDKRYRIKEELMAELNKNSNLDEDIKKYIDEKLEEIINA